MGRFDNALDQKMQLELVFRKKLHSKTNFGKSVRGHAAENRRWHHPVLGDKS